MLSVQKKIGHLENKIDKLSNILKYMGSYEDIYWNIVTEWKKPEVVLSEYYKDIDHDFMNVLNINYPSAGISYDELRYMFLDSKTYLQGDILVKVDRAAMANSLETRVPFLNHRVAEEAWRLPLEMKIRNNQGKWALKQVLYKYVPKELIERPKAGFGIPIGHWLRGPLKDWANSLLDDKLLRSQGYFKVEIIQKKWQEHISGQRDNTASSNDNYVKLLCFFSILSYNRKPYDILYKIEYFKEIIIKY
jgi:asparagine synthase (glutamine-hydrolysing)